MYSALFVCCYRSSKSCYSNRIVLTTGGVTGLPELDPFGRKPGLCQQLHTLYFKINVL